MWQACRHLAAQKRAAAASAVSRRRQRGLPPGRKAQGRQRRWQGCSPNVWVLSAGVQLE